MGEMEDKRQFYQLLNPLRRQLFIKRTLREFHYWLLAAAALSSVILLAARIWVIPFYHEMVLSCCLLLIPICIFRIWRNRPGWKDAAAVFNAFVPEDQVITAFSFLTEEGLVQKLQLAEALRLMKKEQQRVMMRKKGYLLPKWLLAAVLFFCLAGLLEFFPAHTQQLAEQKETELAVLKKIEQQLEEKEKKAKSTETKKALEKAKDMITKKPDLNEALKKLAAQQKELELKALKVRDERKKWQDWQHNLHQADLHQLAAALEEKDVKRINSELEKMNKNYQSLTEKQKSAFGKLNGSNKKLSDQELKELANHISALLDSERQEQELAAAEAAVSQAAGELQKEMAANGLKSRQIALHSSGPAGGNKPTSSSGSNGNPPAHPNSGNQAGNQGTGNSGSSGKGNSSSNGSGTGSGNGSGSGNGGAGNGRGGSGQGGGHGAGLGSGSRELLTIPEKSAGKTNLETDSGTIGKGSGVQQFEGDGPISKGKIRSYQEVYHDYQATYRSSTDRVKLPSELEEMVKTYFSSLDPNKE